MSKSLGFNFSACFIVLMMFNSARADLASTSYVDEQINPVETKIDNHIDDLYGTNADEIEGYAELTDAEMKTKYPTVALVDQMASDARSNSIARTMGGDKNSVMVRNSTGTYVKGTGTDITVADNGAITVNHATTADSATSATQDGNGNVITSTYATQATVNGISDKIGTVPNGKTLVGMISEAQTAATYDDTALAARVSANEGAITTLNGNATTSGSVANSIVTALSEYSKTGADSTYATASDLSTHTGNTDIHVTAADKTAWNAKQGALTTAQLAAANSGITATKVGNYDDHIADTDIHVTAADKTAWNAKQGAIADLADIRAGAAAGATAVQPSAISDMETQTHASNTYQAKALVTNFTNADDTHYPSAKAVNDALGGKQATISDLATIRSNATAGAGAATTIAGYGDIVTHNAAEFASASQGTLAASALQAADITTGTANGTIAVDGTDVAVAGLKSAAYTESSAYATSAQGTKADSALQSVTANNDAGVVTGISKSGTAITMTKAKVGESDLADGVVAKLSAGNSALQAADITTGTANGTIAVDGTDVAVAGLGGAAYKAESYYQTAGNYITVPAANGTTGKSVLTYDADTSTYYWESIGR